MGRDRTPISCLSNNTDLQSAIFYLSGTLPARTLERAIHQDLLYGGFLAISAQTK